MEKPGNFFVIARMWEKQSGSASLLRFHCGTVFSFCLYKPGFSISGSSIPSGLFQTINELKRLMGYTKRLH